MAILDIALPDGSGLDLIPYLKNAGKLPIPVLVFSADDVASSVGHHVDRALVKSRTTNEDLFETIRSLISLVGEQDAKDLAPTA